MPVRPNKGVIITSIPPEHLAEMFEVMGEIEADFARFAARRMTEPERQDLAALHAESGVLAQAGEREAHDQMNMRIHVTAIGDASADYVGRWA